MVLFYLKSKWAIMLPFVGFLQNSDCKTCKILTSVVYFLDRDLPVLCCEFFQFPCKIVPNSVNIDSCTKNMTQFNCKFLLMRSSKKMLFFTRIFPYYVAHDITKEFWKNNHYENTTAGFLLRCQNSLRYDISLIYH